MRSAKEVCIVPNDLISLGPRDKGVKAHNE